MGVDSGKDEGKLGEMGVDLVENGARLEVNFGRKGWVSGRLGDRHG